MSEEELDSKLEGMVYMGRGVVSRQQVQRKEKEQ